MLNDFIIINRIGTKFVVITNIYNRLNLKREKFIYFLKYLSLLKVRIYPTAAERPMTAPIPERLNRNCHNLRPINLKFYFIKAFVSSKIR